MLWAGQEQLLQLSVQQHGLKRAVAVAGPEHIGDEGVEQLATGEKKRKRGATGYNEYEIHIDGEVWKLKTEIRKNSRETLYIAFKKK